MTVDIFAHLAIGMETAFSWMNLSYCLIGVALGTFIGVLPGIGPFATVAMLLPLTFHVPPETSLMMLAGIYYGAQYGGATAAILLNLPGSVSHSVICLDGYPMSQQGRAGVALFTATISSFFGSMVGILILVTMTPLLASFALKFSAPEYFSLMALGLISAAFITQASPIRGIAMILVGLLLGIVGTDITSGNYRFVFGFPPLAEGLNIVAVAMGLFGVPEVIANAGRIERSAARPGKISLRSMLPTWQDVKRFRFSLLRGTAIGAWFGILPGTGTAVAPFISYVVEKKAARDESRFGKGAIEGVAAPEASNNSAAITAFIPTLTLGIPGDVIMALLLSVMIIHGVFPGPLLMENNPDLFWGLVVSFLIGNIALVILNIPLIGIWVRLLSIPYHVLYPAILIFICVGVYTINNSVFDIYLVIVFGFIGYLMLLLGFEPAPLLMGFVLGPMMEEHLRRALTFSRGDFMIFIERPISVTFLILAAAIIFLTVHRQYRRAKDSGHDASGDNRP